MVVRTPHIEPFNLIFQSEFAGRALADKLEDRQDAIEKRGVR